MHRRAFLAAAGGALVVPGVSLAQPVRRRVMRAPSVPLHVTGAPADVPMLRWRMMPAVEVTVNGAGPFLFGIDTGFPGMATFSADVAGAAGLTPAGQDVTSDPSGLNPVAIDRYAVPHLKIGPMTFEGVEGSSLPPMPLPPGEAPLMGILGMALFAGHTISFDFPGAKIAVTSEGLPPADGRTVFAYPDGEFIELPLKIGDVVLPSHLDTGQARRPLMVPQEVVARLPTRGEPRAVGTARTVSQTLQLFAVDLAAPVTLGDITLPVTEIAYPTPVPVGNIGAAALANIVLKVDGRARSVQFIPRPA